MRVTTISPFHVSMIGNNPAATTVASPMTAQPFALAPQQGQACGIAEALFRRGALFAGSGAARRRAEDALTRQAPVHSQPAFSEATVDGGVRRIGGKRIDGIMAAPRDSDDRGIRGIVVPRAAKQESPRRKVMVLDGQHVPDMKALRELIERQAMNIPLEIQRAMAMAGPEFMREMAQAAREVGLMMSKIGFEPGDPEMLPTTAIARQGQLVRYAQVVPKDALVLINKHLLAVLLNDRIVRHDHGWTEVTLEGKHCVIETEAGMGTAPARGDEVTPQDLYDFYNSVFHQGMVFRAYIRLLANRGADVRSLGPVIDELDGLLYDSIQHILARRFDDALATLKRVDDKVSEFQGVMRGIAHTVGLEVHPITGMVYPMIDRYEN